MQLSNIQSGDFTNVSSYEKIPKFNSTDLYSGNNFFSTLKNTVKSDYYNKKMYNPDKDYSLKKEPRLNEYEDRYKKDSNIHRNEKKTDIDEKIKADKSTGIKKEEKTDKEKEILNSLKEKLEELDRIEKSKEKTSKDEKESLVKEVSFLLMLLRDFGNSKKTGDKAENNLQKSSQDSIKNKDQIGTELFNQKKLSDKEMAEIVKIAKKFLNSSEDKKLSGSSNEKSVLNKLKNPKSDDSNFLKNMSIDVKDMRKSDFKKLDGRLRIKKKSLKNSVSDEKMLKTEEIVKTKSLNSEKKSDLSSDHNLLTSKENSFKTLRSEELFKLKGGVKEPKKVFQQIVQRAKIMQKSGMTEMKLNLNPKHLGRVRMSLLVKDGAVTAKISVANESLRDFLNDNLDNLNRELKDAGVVVSDMEILQDGTQSSFSELLSENQKESKIELKTKKQNDNNMDNEIKVIQKHHDGKINLVA